MSVIDQTAAMPSMPLALARPGQPLRLAGIEGGRTMRQRLTSMGLHGEVPLEVVSHTRGGPVILGVNGTRIMVGRGMAHRIRVRPA